MSHYDVIVVGAGILGTFHAYFAARGGHRVLLIERNAFPNDASTRNFGIVAQTIVPSGGEWAAFARATTEIYRTLQEECDISVAQTGTLYLASTELERRVLQEYAALPGSARCQFLEAAEVRALCPSVQPAYCTAGLLFPDDLTVNPRRMLRDVIARSTVTLPITYLPNTTVVAVESSAQGSRVRDVRGNVHTANHTIVCSGAEFRLLFAEHFQQSRVRLCKLQMMQTEPQSAARLPHAVLSGLSIQRYPGFIPCPSYIQMCAQPMEPQLRRNGIHLLFRQMADGSVIVGDSHEYTAWNAGGDGAETTDPRINSAILEYGQRMLALDTWALGRLWNGYYSIVPNREIFTETIGSNVHIVTGIGGKGMTTGPGFSRAHVTALLQ